MDFFTVGDFNTLLVKKYYFLNVSFVAYGFLNSLSFASSNFKFILHLRVPYLRWENGPLWDLFVLKGSQSFMGENSKPQTLYWTIFNFIYFNTNAPKGKKVLVPRFNKFNIFNPKPVSWPYTLLLSRKPILQVIRRATYHHSPSPGLVRAHNKSPETSHKSISSSFIFFWLSCVGFLSFCRLWSITSFNKKTFQGF